MATSKNKLIQSMPYSKERLWRDFISCPKYFRYNKGKRSYYERNAYLFVGLSNAKELSLLVKRNFYQLEDAINNPNYRHYQIVKKKSGFRDIYEPNKLLKAIQGRINFYLQAYYALIKPTEVNGFTINPRKYGKKCNILLNAEQHVNKKSLLNIDLKDFFPSITAQRVRTVFKSSLFEFNEEIATALALLVTYQGKLTTGAPSSPIVSNFICFELDQQLKSYCDERDITYSRYADDLSFSSNETISEDTILDIVSIINRNDFRINEKKLRLRPWYRRQVVTGITVNEKPNVDRKLLKKIRAMLHDLKMNGLESAVCKHFGVSANEVPDELYDRFLNRLFGYINFVGQIRGVEDPMHVRFLKEFKHIKSVQSISGKTQINNISAQIERINEENYLKALTEISNNGFTKKNWLINNFELYKQTLNWPKNLPPINRSNLIKGTLRERFNSTYKELLSEFEYELNNENQMLKIKRPKS
ncbi:MAG: reverse transcriptase family protein [Bacteroidota bacterium]